MFVSACFLFQLVGIFGLDHGPSSVFLALRNHRYQQDKPKCAQWESFRPGIVVWLAHQLCTYPAYLHLYWTCLSLRTPSTLAAAIKHRFTSLTVGIRGSETIRLLFMFVSACFLFQVLPTPNYLRKVELKLNITTDSQIQYFQIQYVEVIIFRIFDCVILLNLLLLFLSCGDVNPNPGPVNRSPIPQPRPQTRSQAPTDPSLNTIPSNLDIYNLQLQTLSQLANLEKTQQLTLASLTALESRLNLLEPKVNSLLNVPKDLATVNLKITSTENNITDLKDRISRLDNITRQKNLIVFGLPDLPNQSINDLSQAVVSLLQTTLSLAIDVKDFDLVTRLGRQHSGNPRPVLLKFLTKSKRDNVLLSAKKFKNTPYHISEDFPPDIRKTRKTLWDITAGNRKNGDRVVLKFDRLFINGKRYILNDNSLVPFLDVSHPA